jgi:hypothetical protein
MTAPRKWHGVEITVIHRISEARAASNLRSCESKKRYADEYAARAAGCRHMVGGAQQLFIYKCKLCRGWHLTRRGQPPYFAADYLEKRGYQ